MKSEEILRHSNLALTNCRVELLEEMIATNHALSHSVLEKTFRKKFDRVTIYRTLNTFVEKGIIHKIPDDSGGVKYAVCSDSCEPHSHDDNHVHFKCNECGQTECIEDVVIPEIKFPKGYKVTEISFLAKGICPKCSQI